MSQPPKPRARKQKFHGLLGLPLRKETIKRLQETRERICPLPNTLIGPVPHKVFQGLRHTDFLRSLLILLRNSDVLVQLAPLDAVELERVVEHALAQLVILGQAVLHFGELARVVDGLFQKLHTTFGQSPCRSAK